MSKHVRCVDGKIGKERGIFFFDNVFVQHKYTVADFFYVLCFLLSNFSWIGIEIFPEPKFHMKFYLSIPNTFLNKIYQIMMHTVNQNSIWRTIGNKVTLSVRKTEPQYNFFTMLQLPVVLQFQKDNYSRQHCSSHA